MNKKIFAIFFAMIAALLYAINIPLSKLLLNKIELTMTASYQYLGAGFGVGLLFLISRKKRSEGVENYTKKDINTFI